MCQLSNYLPAQPAEIVDARFLQLNGKRQAIRVAADVNEQLMDLNKFEIAVLAAIAYHQPLTRGGLKDIFGKDISRDLIGRLRLRELITTGPRSPRAGAPYTYVTTPQFLVAFDLQSLRDLPDMEQLQDAGLVASEV